MPLFSYGKGSITASTAIMECEVSASTGDLVYMSETTAGAVVVATNNIIPVPIIGIIADKISETSCVVVFYGKIDNPGGLDIGGVVWLSPTGGFTNTPPDNNVLQMLAT